MKFPLWLKILLGLFVLLLVVALVIPLFADLNRYRDVIARAVEDQTGRKVSIGEISLRLLPSVGFTIEEVKLGNPPGFADGHLLTVEKLRGGLAIGPLLRKEIAITSLELVRPRLTLLTDSRGKTNYDLEPPRKSPPSRAPAPESSFQLAAIPEIQVSELELVVGNVSRARGNVVQTLRASNLSAELANVVFDAKALKQWSADADLSGVKLELAGLREPVLFRSGELTLRQGALDAKFDLELGSAARGSGSIRVPDIENARPQFELSSPLLDLDALAAATAPAPPSSAPAAVRSELLAQGKISAQKLRYAPLEATNARADLRIFADRIEVPSLTGALYGGSAALSGRIFTAQSPSRFAANLKVQNLDVAKLLDSIPETRGALTGTAELSLDASAPLDSSLLDAITGTGSLAIRDGSLPQFNLGSLQALGKVGELLSGGKSSGGTRFSLITADLNLSGGRVSSNRIHMDSNLGTMDLRGSFGWDKTLAYDGQANLVAGAAGDSGAAGIIAGILGQVTKSTVSGLSIPFAVSGTFDKPRVLPGKGIPSVRTSPSQTTTQTQEPAPQKKKSILDIFRKP